MVGIRIQRKLNEGQDASSNQARHRLRVCCLLVLYVVRLERQARGDTPERVREARLELNRVSHDVKHRLYQLVQAARQALADETTAHHRLRGLFASKSAALLSRLCADDFRGISQGLLNEYVELREWFFEGIAFKEWQNDRPWYMYCYGEPRCGKSSFAAAVARRLDMECSDDPQTVVIALFLGHGADRQRYTTSHGILGAILKQLIEGKIGKNNVLHQLTSKDLKALPYSPNLLQECILKEMTSLKKVYLVVDGLDAHPTDEDSQSLEDGLVRLSSLCATSPCALRLMLVQARTDSSGPRTDQEVWCDVLQSEGAPCGESCKDLYWLCERCDGHFFMCHSCFANNQHCPDPSHTLKVYVEIQSEVSTYIDAKLGDMSTESQIGRRISDAKAISQHIRDDVDEKAGGVLVVAKLFMDSLVEQQSIEEVLDILDRLPIYQRLYYNSLMFEIMSQRKEDKTLALAAIALVAASCKDNGIAMQFDELKEAISFIMERDDLEFTESEVLKCTRGLLAAPDVVTTFHDSASTYLVDECEEILAHHQVNLGCLCIKAIRSSLGKCGVGHDPSPKALVDYLNRHPFIAYACRHWGANIRLASTDEAKESCLTFLYQDYVQQPCLRRLMFLANNDSRNVEMWTGGSQIHLVSWFGLVDTLQQMRRQKDQSLDVNARDSFGRTSLHQACTHPNNQRMTSSLLEMGADPSIADCEGRTVLWEAIERSDPATLGLLLHSLVKSGRRREVLNSNYPHHGGQTLLMLAIQNNNFESNRDAMVEMLLEQDDIDLNVTDSAGRTALHVAAGMGYYNGLHLLTETSKYKCASTIHTIARDKAGRTAAMTALTTVNNEDDPVVKLLAFLKLPQNRAAADAVDNNGRSLLHYAATDECYRSVVDYLKEANADVNKQDIYGRTPLHVAAEMLEAADEQGIVRLLLGMNADLLAKDQQDLTPYDLAFQRDASWANVLWADGDPITKSERKIISWSDAVNDPDAYFANIACLPDHVMGQADPLCYTLLHCAVDMNQLAAVSTLLQNPQVNVNAQNQIYNTALHLALGNMDIVELLLAHEQIDVNILDHQGQSALERTFDLENDDHKLPLAIALIKKGAHLVLPRKTRQEILRYAISAGEDLEAVTKLLGGGTILFQYCRPGLLPSETAKEDGEGDQTIQQLRKLESDVLDLVAT